MKSRHSFTLIELLTVMAVVSVMFAMLLPALRSSRDSAKRLQCQSNLHQIGLAIHMYANDHRDMLPYARTFPWETQVGQPDPEYLQDTLIPYIGGAIGDVAPIYRCPSVKPQWIKDSTNCYRYNYYFADGWNIPQTGQSVGRIAHPVEAVLVYDIAWFDWPFLDLPHEGVNACYGDGHVSYIKGEQYLPNGHEQTGSFCSTGW